VREGGWRGRRESDEEWAVGNPSRWAQAILPPEDEQRAIVRFLDHADRKIRKYIRAKQKLIQLLEEQRQAIIHQAVTRGLDPNVRLKRSGVEWLAEVSEHWSSRGWVRR
jgi:type I restriction enzyme S subunit